MITSQTTMTMISHMVKATLVALSARWQRSKIRPALVVLTLTQRTPLYHQRGEGSPNLPGPTNRRDLVWAFGWHDRFRSCHLGYTARYSLDGNIYYRYIVQQFRLVGEYFWQMGIGLWARLSLRLWSRYAVHSIRSTGIYSCIIFVLYSKQY